MFNRNTSYSLNKKDKTGIVYTDAYGNITRITESDLGSIKEFRKWKNWTKMKDHSEEKKDHIYRNHTVCGTNLYDSLSTIPSMEDQFEQEEVKKEFAQSAKCKVNIIKMVLTDTQFRRLWMYYVEDKNTYEIAQIEGTTHQAISKSIKAARKKLLIELQKEVDKTL